MRPPIQFSALMESVPAPRRRRGPGPRTPARRRASGRRRPGADEIEHIHHRCSSCTFGALRNHAGKLGAAVSGWGLDRRARHQEIVKRRIEPRYCLLGPAVPRLSPAKGRRVAMRAVIYTGAGGPEGHHHRRGAQARGAARAHPRAGPRRRTQPRRPHPAPRPVRGAAGLAGRHSRARVRRRGRGGAGRHPLEGGRPGHGPGGRRRAGRAGDGAPGRGAGDSRGLSFAEAAAIPEVFLTAYDALVTRGRLAAGRAGADPRGGQRRRHRGGADRQASRRHGARHLAQRREAGARAGVRARRRDRHRRAGRSATPWATRWTWCSTCSAGPRSPTTWPCWRRAAGWCCWASWRAAASPPTWGRSSGSGSR